MGIGPARWTTHLVRIGLLGATVAACSSRGPERAFLARRVPVARLDSVLKAADSVRLPLAAARALLGVTAESGFAARAPHDSMTLAEIVTWAREEQARKRQADAAASAAERARQDSVRKLLEPLLAVTIVKKTYLPKDPASEQYEDYISLAFAYENKGTKPMRAFQGDATFLDTFGDSIYSAHLKVDLALAPGQSRREPARIVRFNPFRVAHQRLRDTPLNKMKLVWETTDVVFADGTRLSLAGDHEAP
ncbi:MAG: hypothetical protein DMD73_07090 [Gemmatimonadetes bacterium]|nr:MAG: hypothetical protein DMD73_07090 [Gemmatimonadota bacterium]